MKFCNEVARVSWQKHNGSFPSTASIQGACLVYAERHHTYKSTEKGVQYSYVSIRTLRDKYSVYRVETERRGKKCTGDKR